METSPSMLKNTFQQIHANKSSLECFEQFLAEWGLDSFLYVRHGDIARILHKPIKIYIVWNIYLVRSFVISGK
jgi:hypothetical protein